MKLVVIGGTGLIGRQVLVRLRTLGREAVAASPASGVNTLTGEGLAEALQGTEVVIDVANSPSFDDAASGSATIPRVRFPGLVAASNSPRRTPTQSPSC